MKTKIRPTPCRYCPYRRDVPSGVWAEEEYRKLPAYDNPTGQQPFEPFACHEVNQLLCAGWAQCEQAQKPGHELIALRLIQFDSGEIVLRPPGKVPLFASGLDAAIHGLKQLRRPGKAARLAMTYIVRLRAGQARARKERKATCQ